MYLLRICCARKELRQPSGRRVRSSNSGAGAGAAAIVAASERQLASRVNFMVVDV